MKFLSWNVCGLDSWRKRALIKNLIQQQNPNLVLIQETKKSSITSTLIKYIWSSSHIGWSSLDSVGASGGILILWRDLDFTIRETIQGLYSLSIHIVLADDFDFWLLAIYGPSRHELQDEFGQELHDFVGLARADGSLGVISMSLDGLGRNLLINQSLKA